MRSTKNASWCGASRAEFFAVNLFGVNLLAVILLGGFLLGCSPRVELSSEKPITINMNVKIDHEVRVKVEKDLDSVINENSKLF